jgi:serine/threonine-protein kinase
VCVAATAPDRAYRPASARDLGDAVQRFLDGNRDLTLRKELARAELRAAQTALASGNGPAERRDALRAAARALALDPSDRAPADLVGRLMIEPPPQVPPEVEAELANLDLDALRTSARFGIFAAIAYLAFFPLLYWVGFRDLWYLIAGPAISIFIIWVELVVAPRNAYLSGYLAITGNLAMFALFSWMVSPIVVGPGPAIIIVTLLAVHRQLIPTWLLAGLTIVATLTPWLLEAVGITGARTSVVGGDLVMHTVARELGGSATIAALVIYLVSIVFLAALLARLQDDERRDRRRKIQLQAWQLKQLVPRVATLPPT